MIGPVGRTVTYEWSCSPGRTGYECLKVTVHTSPSFEAVLDPGRARAITHGRIRCLSFLVMARSLVQAATRARISALRELA